MLTGLRLGNFKAFGETQNIPIKPLTLIFGANSAGKSSIIHGLLLARHASETGNLDAHKIKMSGDAVDLGGFQQYVHRRDTGKRVEWGMSLKLSVGDELDFVSVNELTAFRYPRNDNAHKAVNAYKLLSKQAKQLDVVAQIAQPDDDALNIYLIEYLIYTDGALIARLRRDENGIVSREHINIEHALFATVWKYLQEIEESTSGIWGDSSARMSYEDFIEDHDTAELPESLEALIASGTYQGSFLPDTYFRLPVHFAHEAGVAHEQWREAHENTMEIDTDFARSEYALSAVASAEMQNADILALYRRLVQQGYKTQCLIEDVVSRIVQDATNLVTWKLKSVKYIAPLRVVPSRHVAFLDNQHSSWYLGGSQWDYIRRNSEVRDKVNLWLGSTSKMKSPYQLQVRRYTSEDRRSDVIEELVLHDKRFDTYVSPKDVGFGISQVLPVLVSAYGSEKQVIAIEQPEIHLHPALQAELGDVFIESALGERKNTFLLETHSEHLILRIMRRMRDTVRGTLPEGMPPVRPEDVAILYVDRKDDDSTSVVSVLELDEEGQLLDPWPGGFFEEGFNERFA